MPLSTSSAEKDLSQITTYQSGVIQAAAHRVLNRVVSDFLLQYDLTAMQWFIIGHIYDRGDAGLRMTDLTKLLDTSLPYTTNTINLLESKEIVRKKIHQKDSRTKLVSITPSYRSTVEEIEIGLREQMREQLYKSNRISREELQAYIDVLYKIVRAGQPGY